uniref:Uncharacterized protein n=1 Tax=Rhizophora mucronata TaxID=61149 RepID=A0A2P2LYG2_RHIMU
MHMLYEMIWEVKRSPDCMYLLKINSRVNNVTI